MHSLCKSLKYATLSLSSILKYFSEFREGESNTLDENHKQIQNTKIDFKNLQKECINEIIKNLI